MIEALLLFSVSVVAFAIGYASRRSKTAPAAPAPQLSPDERWRLGFDTPGDQKVPIAVRDWSAMRLAVWRSKVAWDVVERAAVDVVDRCKHTLDCPGKSDYAEPCLRGCPDREVRMSALVVLSAARQFKPVDAGRPADAPYFAPSRERYSEVMAELEAALAELEVLRAGADSRVLDAIASVLRTAPTASADSPVNRLRAEYELDPPQLAEQENDQEEETTPP